MKNIEKNNKYSSIILMENVEDIYIKEKIMSSCLGLSIEKNLIKYARVSKNRDNIKVESFGVKFYDKIGEAIDQIVQETYSQKTPISVNLSEEMYNYFNVFALLNKNDLQKAIKTEFDYYCSEKGYNPNVFETRPVIVNNKLEKDKIRIIHISSNKIELNKSIEQIGKYNLNNISPVAMTIPNLIDSGESENSVIVNIEDETAITTILNGGVHAIEKIEHGSENILSKINRKENSYSKAYEICKNTTIYTSEGRELQEEENYLEDIMPTLYEIVGAVRKIINNSEEKIQKLYITGTAALINNIDLYFQEYFSEVQCEILKPYFIPTGGNINIKDYVEVNSAISLAASNLGEGISGINFKKQGKLPSWLSVEVGPGRSDKGSSKAGGFFEWDLGQKLDKTEHGLLRLATGLLMLVIIYCAFSIGLTNQMNSKIKQGQESIEQTNAQIDLARQDNIKIKSKINDYSNLIKNLEDVNSRLAERNKMKNIIPNLLNQIMVIVPRDVQLVSIENTAGNHITIVAKSNQYEQLGYLKAKIKTDVILTNVISTAGEKSNDEVTVTIEGDLL